ncbi:MAG: uracil-DNA glycosylase [Clostridia bacterium]|nr:uracil-DNA glycosylase [Clostridia bacterium]MBQ2316102.1 uracil-DNA glycosylase [Clostridia bacterium]
MVNIGNDWDNILADEWEKPYYKKLRVFLKTEYGSHTVYPDMHDIFNALKYTSFADTRVVIIGQDPYHGVNQAHGLCFSVQKGVEPPPSLKNIYKELKDDIGMEIPSHGCLTSWAKQGVLLLNTVLTVREASPNSHKGMGWESFTDRVISELDRKQTPVVFLLWGANARKKAEIIRNPIHKKLITVHPSPLSAYGGFFGCRHFSLANRILEESGQPTIDWRL